MKQITLCLLFFILGHNAIANGKLSISTQLKIEQIKDKNELYPLMIEGDIASLYNFVESYGGRIGFTKSRYATVFIKVKDLNFFLEQSFITRVEDGRVPVQLLMDTALINNNVYPIHSGIAPLSQAYTGKDVLVGIIDDGIDWRHEDFKNDDGTSRIHYIWDQNNATPSNAPLPYQYGQEWKKSEINSATLSFMEPWNISFSHGSNVSGIAVGNARASGLNKGNAPKAELIVVAINNNNNFLYNVVDAIDYIFKKADAMGKPCVINTSIGTYFGSHDGLDIPTKMIEALLEERKGRVIVAAAGNAGQFNYHLGYDITSDTSFTWFKYNNGNNGVYWEFWADTNNFNKVKFGICADSSSGNFTEVSVPVWFDFSKDFPNVVKNKSASISKNILKKNGSFLGTMNVQIDYNEGRYNGQIYIVPNDQTLNWRYSTTGVGRFDVWSHSALVGTSNMIETGLPDSTVLPTIKYYKLPDNKKNTVSSWQCSNKVITVANYNNRSFYLDVDSVVRNTGVIPGEISGSSSNGPTRDGRTKPDLSATGNFVVAAIGLNTRANFMSNGNRFKVGLRSWHSRNGGTSMASPQVAGVAALLLEKNPNYGYREIKQLLLKSALNDNFTTNIRPNNVWGYGKLNGFDAFTYPAVYGCMDTGSINFNPLANIEDGSCIAKVYGCKDTGSINYNPQANIDNGTCIKKVYGCTDSLAINYNPKANKDNGTCIYKVLSLNSNSHFLNIYPNPVIDFLHIQSSEEISKIEIFNQIGQLISKPIYSFDKHKFDIKLSAFDSGILNLKITYKSGKSIFHKVRKEN